MSIDELEGVPQASTAVALRRLFDDTFTVPAEMRADCSEDLLAIRVGSNPYALRLSEIAGLHADLKIVPVPTPAAQLLGIVGIRGTMAPIYDLAALLGYPPITGPRWIAFARAQQSVGFAFETFESHLRVAQTSSDGSVRAAGLIRPIIHMASVVAMLKG